MENRSKYIQKARNAEEANLKMYQLISNSKQYLNNVFNIFVISLLQQKNK